MKYGWLHNDGRDRVVVFCNGWGMDPRPFRPLGTRKYDVLNLYDFRETDAAEKLPDLLAGYDEYTLLGWSMGVWAGQRLFADRRISFTRTIAVNGTLCPVDDRYGIPRDLFAGTMAGWSELARCKFYHRLCGGRDIEQRFLENQPERSLAGQQEELAYYLDVAGCIGVEKSIYREIVVSDKDRIVPTEHQLAYWGHDKVVRVAGSHFPFYRWTCWDDLLAGINGCRE